LRARLTEVFQARGVPGQVTGDASLFRLLLTSRPLHSYRDAADSAAEARLTRIFYHLLEAGVVVNSNGLGCLSTPMREREVEEIAVALERGPARLREETNAGR